MTTPKPKPERRARGDTHCLRGRDGGQPTGVVRAAPVDGIALIEDRLLTRRRPAAPAEQVRDHGPGEQENEGEDNRPGDRRNEGVLLDEGPEHGRVMGSQWLVAPMLLHRSLRGQPAPFLRVVARPSRRRLDRFDAAVL